MPLKFLSMRKIVVPIVSIVLFFTVESKAQKKVVADFPATMPTTVKAEYQRQFDKGLVLYDINCARCHNVTIKKKVYIPDFTVNELMNYDVRRGNATHEDEIPETQVTTEELGYIIIFLNYKKRNDIEVRNKVK